MVTVEESVEIAEGSSIEDLFAPLVPAVPTWPLIADRYRRLPQPEFAAWTTPLQSGDEVAFLPPVSGG